MKRNRHTILQTLMQANPRVRNERLATYSQEEVDTARRGLRFYVSQCADVTHSRAMDGLNASYWARLIEARDLGLITFTQD